MDDFFEICHTQIPFDKILEYRVIEREYIYRPAYTAVVSFFQGKHYHFDHMVPYAAIYDETEHKSAIKAFKVLTSGEAATKEVADGLLSTIGDKFNIKVWKYSKYTCRNQAGRIFSTYLQDVPASVTTTEGKRSEVYPNDELYKELGEPIAPAIEFVPALVILTKAELFTFYGNGIQVDAEIEYERLKNEMRAYKSAGEVAVEEKKAVSAPKLKMPRLSVPNVQISLPQLPKKSAELLEETYDPLDLNHDGVVDEKDMELLQERLKK